MAIVQKSINLNKEFNFKDGLRSAYDTYYYKVKFSNGKKRIVRSWKELPIGTKVEAAMKWGNDRGVILTKTTEKPHLHSWQMPKIKGYVKEYKKPDEIDALLVRPGKAPERIKVIPDEKSLEKLLGNIGTASIDDNVKILNGDLDGNVMNRAVYQKGWNIAAIVSGSFLVVGDDAGKTVSLPDDEMQKYEKMFEKPDIFTGMAETMLQDAEDQRKEEEESREELVSLEDDDDYEYEDDEDDEDEY